MTFFEEVDEQPTETKTPLNAGEVLDEIVKLKPNGETRPQQKEMVEKIEECLNNKTNVLIEGPTGAGKALAIDTPILTVNGWSTMGELQVGDIIFNEEGKQTTVTVVHPILYDRTVYNISAQGNTLLSADAEHLWSVSTSNLRERTSQVLNNKKVNSVPNELIELKKLIAKEASNLEETSTLLDIASKFNVSYEIVEKVLQKITPVSGEGKNVKYNTVELLENFYIESLKDIPSKNFILDTLTTEELKNSLKWKDQAIPVLYEPLDIPEREFDISPHDLGSYLYNLYNDNEEKTLLPLSDDIEEKIKNKLLNSDRVIPEEYLLSSPSQRYELINVLFGKDLSLHSEERSSFVATNDENSITLLKNLFEVVSSLGYMGYLNSYNYMKSSSLYILPKNEENSLRFIEDITQAKRVPVRCITVDSPSHLFLAGRNLVPTHNSISYLLPVILSGKKAIISTATKQLSEQLNDTEMPFLQKSLLKTHPAYAANDYALLKGRDNYYCYRKADIQAQLDSQSKKQQQNQLGVFDGISEEAKKKGNEYKQIDEWSENATTGDRSEAPVVSDETWKNYSSNSAECPGASICPFGEKCFAEKAREKASKAQIVITNHALTSIAVSDDPLEPKNILGDREVVVFDELHELENYLSSAWSAKITTKQLSEFMKEIKKTKEIKEETILSYEKAVTILDISFEHVENGLIESLSPEVNEAFRTIQRNLLMVSSELKKKLKGAVISKQTKEIVASLGKRSKELYDWVTLILDDSVETVRWYSIPEEPRKKRKGVALPEKIVTIHAAPLLVGPRLQKQLEEKEMIMIGASATVRVAGKFDIPLHNLGLDTVKNSDSLAVTSPFDFPKQGMIYIPNSEFPAPVGSERLEHTLAAQKETLELVEAAGGRALVLTTTTYDAQKMAEFLRSNLKNKKVNVMLQGDAPQKQLVAGFAAEETSVLVATMGLWHGLDVQGPSLSLVVINKIPFKPLHDPLSLARQKYAESKGRNGFMDVYVASANVMLAQGVGRLIRHAGDKGVVALLDTRLLSKAYGKDMLKSLPNMKIFTNKKIVIDALKRLTGNADK